MRTIKGEEEGEEITILYDLEKQQEEVRLVPGVDVTELLAIQKYELPSQLSMGTSGRLKLFPSFIRKTDQTRIQNLTGYWPSYCGLEYEVTEKVEGTSITIYYHKGMVGICSRNQTLQFETEEHKQSAVYLLAQELQIEQKLMNYQKSIAVQGEFIGPKIQANIYQLKTYQWLIFDVYLILEARYATPEERLGILKELGLEAHVVPSLGTKLITEKDTIEEILKSADGTSLLRKGVLREGLVFKSLQMINGHVTSFKAVSNAYLLKQR